jgi:hypothetical protein
VSYFSGTGAADIGERGVPSTASGMRQAGHTGGWPPVSAHDFELRPKVFSIEQAFDHSVL